jgi:hypothetical protein
MKGVGNPPLRSATVLSKLFTYALPASFTALNTCAGTKRQFRDSHAGGLKISLTMQAGARVTVEELRISVGLATLPNFTYRRAQVQPLAEGM